MRNSRYFADIFGNISEDVDTMVLRRQGGCLPGEEPEAAEEEPMRNVSYATMRTVIDFFESGVLKVGEQGGMPFFCQDIEQNYDKADVSPGT